MANEDSQQKATPTLSAGDTLGKYEVREVLGVGGQSVVYKGYDPLLDREVAIKQLAPHLTQDKSYLNRMRENVQTIAKLGAKNEAIVNILDIIEEPGGLFYVMDYVEGPTLQHVINDAAAATEPRAVLLILFRLAAALHDVHAEGIVHRDVKPSNIIITEGLRPKIIDFGVAALHDDDVSMPLATTKYLAPEVYSAETVDGRSDIYSLGFIAYELLLGPETFNEVFADIVRDRHSTALRWMKWHGNESVAAPPLHEVDPSIPLSLSHLVARMIEKDPDNRFQNTEELGRAMKESFSTKAKRAGTTGAARPAGETRAGAAVEVGEGVGTLYEEGLREMESQLPAPAGPTRRPRPTGDGDMEGPATAPLPSDDVEGPPTAPLPKGPMSRKTKVRLAVAGGAVLLLLIVGAAWWMLHQKDLARQRMQQADQLYAEAINHYEEGEYGQAIAGFTTLMRSYPGTRFARQARVQQSMAEAWQAIHDRNWDEAQRRENEAEETIDRLQKQSDNPNLTEWTRRRENELRELNQTRLSSQSFHNALARARQALSATVREEDYIDALRTLKDDLASSEITTTPEQEAQAAALKDRIRRERVVWLFEHYVSNGDQQMQTGNLARAERAYSRALSLMGGDDEDAKLIPADQREQMRQSARIKLQQLARRRLQSTKLQELADAETSGNPIEIRQALEALLKEADLPGDDRQRYQQRLKQLDVKTGLAAAKDALAKGDQPAARAALQQVLQADPDSAEAKSMLENIAKAAQKQKLISEGDALLAERTFDEALKKYSQAAGMGGAGAELRDKINECSFNLTLQKALAAREAGKYVEAERHYERAKTLKPDAKLVIDAQIKDMRVEQTFDTLKAQGDELLAQKKWDEAIKVYQEAKAGLTAGKVQRKQAAEKAVTLAKYKKYVELGDEAAAINDVPTARWYYGLAQREMNTPEIRRKLQSVGGSG
ncbi:MAG: protein kinase [Planctomycetes bacterium]|jgi:serine/threonine-protein kinase|nr:protein kinase [Phycisphaerae bacterium]NBB96159.1 protein kinase [Planctomycetota bacterium]